MSGPRQRAQDPAEAPPSIRDAAEIIERQRQLAAARIEPDARLLYGVWGAAWLVGFGTFYLVAARIVGVPIWVAGLVFFGVLTAAGAITGVHITGRVRGVRGHSQSGAMHGIAWLVGLAALAPFLVGTVQLGMSVPAQAALFAGAFPFLVGVLYLAGGALWQDRLQYGMGVWIILAAAVSPFVGVPGNYLVLALAGGGGLLVATGYFAMRGDRAAR